MMSGTIIGEIRIAMIAPRNGIVAAAEAEGGQRAEDDGDAASRAGAMRAATFQSVVPPGGVAGRRVDSQGQERSYQRSE